MSGQRTPAEAPVETMVTFLEMSDPTRAPRVHITGRKLALLKAEKPPLHFYRYLYHAVGRPWLWVSRLRMTDDELAGIIYHESNEIYVLYVEGVPAGFIELDFRNYPDAWLSFLGLVPEFIGQGLGAYLLEAGIDIAWLKGISRLRLSTCSHDHPRALPLYQRFGFEVYDRRRDIIVPMPEDYNPFASMGEDLAQE